MTQMFWYKSQLCSIDRVARIGGKGRRWSAEEGDESDDDDEEISRLVDEGKPIGSPRSNNEEEESNRGFLPSLRVRAESCAYLQSRSRVLFGRRLLPRATDERPMNGEEFSRYSESQLSSTLLSAARRRSWPRPDLGAHTQGVPLLLFSAGQRRDTLARWSIWEILTRAIMPTYPDVRYWNLYRTVLCIWKFVEQVWSGVSSAFKGNAWFSIEVTVTYPFAGFYNTRV